ncbi:hypothetical protein BGZ65_004651 [Modicella reniformis]|uniref:Uncharacterized protein n=1 Tax=Modicella reniformis TaxID=1440133 RepID=A0A9P6SV59_9FUNG|nr:hypothetical protein BGZ65_004651 [Modicella reniformis]
MQSTQRVEKTHHLLKMLELNSNSSPVAVLKASSTKIDQELFRVKYIKDPEGKKAAREEFGLTIDVTLTGQMLLEVVQANGRLLGDFARNKMRRKWTASLATLLNRVDAGHYRTIPDFTSLPGNTYMDNVHFLFASESAIPPPSKAEQLRKMRYANVLGIANGVAVLASRESMSSRNLRRRQKKMRIRFGGERIFKEEMRV